MARKTSPYWPFEDIAITEIYLDQKNIRIPLSNQAQDALIQDLFVNEDAMEIVRSFVQNNLFSDEFPTVVKEKGKYVVIEGNRRIAALKALNEPHLVPAFRDKIKALKNPKITSIRAIVAPNREIAIKHIANKHTVNYRRAWKPLRQAYFYKSQLENGKTIDQLIQEYPGHDIVKFIKMLEMHHLAKSQQYFDDEIKLTVHDERKFPITNLERMYENSAVQNFLGVSFMEDGKVKVNINKNEFNKGYKRIIEDIAEGKIDSRKTNKGEQIEAYLKDLPAEYIPDKTQKTNLSTKSFKEEKVDKEELSKNIRSNKKTIGLFNTSHVPYKLKTTALRFLYDELKSINVKNFPNATYDLLRTFLECTTVYYLKETKEFSKVQKDAKHIPKLSDLLAFIMSDNCTSISDNNIKQAVAQIKSDYDKPYSLVRLNMGNHNENWSSGEQDVRLAWSKLENLMKILLNPPQIEE